MAHTRIFLKDTNYSQQYSIETIQSLNKRLCPEALAGETTNQPEPFPTKASFCQLCFLFKEGSFGITCCTGFFPPFEEEENILQTFKLWSGAPYLKGRQKAEAKAWDQTRLAPR